jgi:hypothetical protein
VRAEINHCSEFLPVFAYAVMAACVASVVWIDESCANPYWVPVALWASVALTWLNHYLDREWPHWAALSILESLWMLAMASTSWCSG